MTSNQTQFADMLAHWPRSYASETMTALWMTEWETWPLAVVARTNDRIKRTSATFPDIQEWIRAAVEEHARQASTLNRERIAACPHCTDGWVSVSGPEAVGVWTVKPCQPCRPDVFERWASGEYRSTLR